MISRLLIAKGAAVSRALLRYRHFLSTKSFPVDLREREVTTRDDIDSCVLSTTMRDNGIGMSEEEIGTAVRPSEQICDDLLVFSDEGDRQPAHSSGCSTDTGFSSE